MGFDSGICIDIAGLDLKSVFMIRKHSSIFHRLFFYDALVKFIDFFFGYLAVSSCACLFYKTFTSIPVMFLKGRKIVFQPVRSAFHGCAAD